MIPYAEKIDIFFFYVINRHWQNPLFDVLMPVMSTIENFYIPLAACWLWLIFKKGAKHRIVALAIVALIGLSEWVCSDLLKPFFDRPRPYHSLSSVHKYERMARDKPIHQRWHLTPELKETIRGESYSLPSAHATNIFAAALFLSVYFRKLWPFFYLIAALVGYSRVYLGDHFPFDVFVGSLVGTSCALVFIWITNRVIGFFETRVSVPERF